ncbi:protein kinase-like protein [Xylariomycetidae sp. FL2044]|nr:protein kinase-like protein [Xylariomycetidae sp. FL2044]
MIGIGSQGIIERYEYAEDVFVKKPHREISPHTDRRIANGFHVELQILSKLPPHPHVVRFLGELPPPPVDPSPRELLPGMNGILLGAASHGNLQAYLDSHARPSTSQQLQWCLQLAQAFDHIHSHGVLHCDLRPENILVHETTEGSRDLLLCDFGGAVCEELNVDGGQLPDGSFYSPLFGNNTSTLLDIFSVGSVFYTITTGRWPYKSTPGAFESFEESEEWEKIVYPQLRKEKFPDVEGLPLGGVIMKCWKRQYKDARELVHDIEEYIRQSHVTTPDTPLTDTPLTDTPLTDRHTVDVSLTQKLII